MHIMANTDHQEVKEQGEVSYKQLQIDLTQLLRFALTNFTSFDIVKQKGKEC